MKFIRDDIRVRDLDARYKKVMRREANKFSGNVFRYGAYWHGRFDMWALAAAVEKVYLRGA